MPTLEQASAFYAQNDGVHDFDHVERVYHLAERLAIAEGADLEIVRAAALLHDVEGSDPRSGKRDQHHIASADYAARVLKEEGWAEDKIAAVQHCIRAHRFRGDNEPPTTLEARVIYDADKLDVLGAVGIARTIAFGALKGQPIFREPSERFLKFGEKEVGEPHSLYHEYLLKLINVMDRLSTPSARAIAEQRHLFMITFFKQLRDEINGCV